MGTREVEQMVEHDSSNPMTAPSWRARARSRALALTAALVLAAGLGVAGRLAAEGQARAFRQSFPGTPGGTLRLANLAGRVELVSVAGNQVVVDAEVHAELPGAGETQRLLQEMKWVRAQDAK